MKNFNMTQEKIKKSKTAKVQEMIFDDRDTSWKCCILVAIAGLIVFLGIIAIIIIAVVN